MTKISLRSHPEVLFANSSNNIEMILRIENPQDHPIWVETDVSIPENLSLSPNTSLKKGRVRIGIIGKNEYLEKAIRIYGSQLTSAQQYQGTLVLYFFNKDGVIENRLEHPFEVKCEIKKEATF